MSLGRPLLFLRSNHRHFDCGLVVCPLASCLRVGVGATTGSDIGAACGGGDRHMGGQPAGGLLLSSSCVEVVISSKRRLLGHVAGVGVVQGGNNIVKYCWMIGLGIT